MGDSGWKVLGLLSPFVSAFLASWVTFHVGQRRARSDAFLKARLDAARDLLAAVSKVARYCEARVSEWQGNENGSRRPEGLVTALVLLDEMGESVSRAAVFLTESEHDRVTQLTLQLSLAASFERAIPEIGEGEAEQYERIGKACGDVERVIIGELRESYGLAPLSQAAPPSGLRKLAARLLGAGPGRW